jgi:hypothetical protein
MSRTAVFVTIPSCPLMRAFFALVAAAAAAAAFLLPYPEIFNCSFHSTDSLRAMNESCTKLIFFKV